MPAQPGQPQALLRCDRPVSMRSAAAEGSCSNIQLTCTAVKLPLAGTPWHDKAHLRQHVGCVLQVQAAGLQPGQAATAGHIGALQARGCIDARQDGDAGALEGALTGHTVKAPPDHLQCSELKLQVQGSPCCMLPGRGGEAPERALGKAHKSAAPSWKRLGSVPPPTCNAAQRRFSVGSAVLHDERLAGICLAAPDNVWHASQPLSQQPQFLLRSPACGHKSCRPCAMNSISFTAPRRRS